MSDARIESSADLALYLEQASRVPLLTAEQEVEIAKRIEAGLVAEDSLETATGLSRKAREEYEWIKRDGERAKDELIEANLRLVVDLAKQKIGRGLAFLDLIQEGNLGLIRAVERFDYRKGWRFSTFATKAVSGKIQRALNNQARAIRIPARILEIIDELNRVQRRMLQDLGREPSVEELACEAGYTPEKVGEVRRFQSPLSIDYIIGDGDGDATADVIVDSHAINPADCAVFNLESRRIRELVNLLNEHEMWVVRWLYGLVDGEIRSSDEIGQWLALSRFEVEMIEGNALRRLRAMIARVGYDAWPDLPLSA